MKKILIYNSGGGLGDSIQIIPLILSLKNHYRRSKIFYLGAHPNHFDGKLKEYNINIETLELNLQYFGFRWWHLLFASKRASRNSLGKFDLIGADADAVMVKYVKSVKSEKTGFWRFNEQMVKLRDGEDLNVALKRLDEASNLVDIDLSAFEVTSNTDDTSSDKAEESKESTVVSDSEGEEE
jgi:hypothetical protein